MATGNVLLEKNGEITRRGFLGGGAMFAAASMAGGCRSLFTGSASDYDDGLTVLLSDVHIGSSSVAPKYQPMKFEPRSVPQSQPTPASRTTSLA